MQWPPYNTTTTQDIDLQHIGSMSLLENHLEQIALSSNAISDLP